MTERLYYTDSYRTQFDAVVSAVTQLDERPALVLDRTCFYPTSGGQAFDTGTLADLPIVDVVVANGKIYHILDTPAASALEGTTVHGKVNWPRRFDHMQQHSGQHLISQVFHRLYAYETISVHFGDEDSTVDLDTAEVTEKELAEAEALANRLVFQDIPIKSYFVDETEIASVPLRRPPKVTGQIRIVEIEETDWSACGGTHVRNTAEIGPVKFIRQTRMRGQARLTFLCGQRAIGDYVRKHELITAVAALYDTEIGQTPVLVARDMDRLKEMQHQLGDLQTLQLSAMATELLQSADVVDSRRVIVRAFDDLDANAVKTLANLLVENEGVVALLGTTQGAKATIVFARAADVTLHAGNLLRGSMQRFGGGGGGRPEFAQGGGVAPGNVNDLLDYAVERARDELSSHQ